MSFSGLKTAALLLVRREAAQGSLDDGRRADIAREFQHAVVDVLVAKALGGARRDGIDAARRRRRRGRQSRIARAPRRPRSASRGGQVFFPDLEFCTDNGAMIALVGALRLARAQRGGLRVFGRCRDGTSSSLPAGLSAASARARSRAVQRPIVRSLPSRSCRMFDWCRQNSSSAIGDHRPRDRRVAEREERADRRERRGGERCERADLEPQRHDHPHARRARRRAANAARRRCRPRSRRPCRPRSRGIPGTGGRRTRRARRPAPSSRRRRTKGRAFARGTPRASPWRRRRRASAPPPPCCRCAARWSRRDFPTVAVRIGEPERLARHDRERHGADEVRGDDERERGEHGRRRRLE